MSQTQALVETLTAEVRVLMVGNRQITLSAARQLDVIPLADLQVMGRVRIDKDYDYVIGAATSGTLAVARYRDRWYPSPHYITAEDLAGQVTVCAALSPDDRDDYRLAIDAKAFRLDRSAVEKCTVPEHSRWSNPRQECGKWTASPEVLDQIRFELAAQIREQAADAALHKAAAAAPLIVLAGLK